MKMASLSSSSPWLCGSVAKSCPIVACFDLASRREPFLDRSASRRQVSQSIGVVNFAKDAVRKADAVDSPAAVQRGAGGRAKLRRMIEVLIEGFEEPPMGLPELFFPAAGIAVGSEEDSILILKEELSNHQGSSAQVLQCSGDFNIGVGILVQQRGDFIHIIVQHGHVRVDEARPWMLGVHVLACFFDHLRSRLPGLIVIPFRTASPKPGFVAFVLRTDGKETAI